MNKLSSFEINKYIIAKFGVDMAPLFRDRDLLEGVISGYTKKKAAAILDEIENKNSENTSLIEQDTINMIQRYHEMSSRGKRFAIILLLMARARNMISIDSYKKLREFWGFKEYAPDIEDALKEPEVREDDFSKLQ